MQSAALFIEQKSFNRLRKAESYKFKAGIYVIYIYKEQQKVITLCKRNSSKFKTEILKHSVC